MKELAGRLAALDPDAGAALRVVAYFDRLMEARVGLEALVRGAAVLSGSPARLVDARRGVRVRVEPDGRRNDVSGPVDPAWPCLPLVPNGLPVAGDGPAPLAAAAAFAPPPATPAPAGADEVAALWLERPGPPDGVHAMVLERASAALRAVLDRTRGRASAVAPAEDPALVEVLLDPSAPPSARLHAAGRLGLRTTQRVRAVALYGGGAEIRSAVEAGRPPPDGRRAGVGPTVDPAGLPRSWAAARTALRLTADGTAQDPGPRTVYAEDLGALTLLAAAVGPDTPPVPDLLALEHAIAEAPWAAATLHAVANAPSLRSAAAELTVHHSTLQQRLVQAEHLLGWDVHSPQGRLRLQLAFTVRKLRQTSPTVQPGGGPSR
ncbi:helix-turn-helix domain-containing protein [Kitasatospora sp. NPDC059327]|uniref:helix-turn-helix domain-containing protein n=1 Tax=Kitasatospora sp. NPDC059327 TaxID=3346803 RepID=UPI00367E06EB